MSSSSESDWVSTAVGGVIFLALVAMAGVFAVDRFQAIFTPKQYAAAQGTQHVEREAESARVAAAEKVIADDKAKADAKEWQANIYYGIASVSYSTMKASLRDPDSAIFRDVWAVNGTLDGSPVTAACGVVNAKNAYGAYVGEQPFMATSIVWTPDRPGFAEAYRSVCLDGEKLMEMH